MLEAFTARRGRGHVDWTIDADWGEEIGLMSIGERK
jgi:hypothetical protein